ncbi:MAG: dTDP-4-dehydrorhamnose 3,5-epimerase [Deltaproteobacteria bacterium]|nr:dTDP-4-dehydrorhamnose 3,5-epimerase [Deltaproteobacteria bacterium]
MFSEKTPIEGAFIINFKKIEDGRGFFGRVFCREEFRKIGVPFTAEQANMSGNLVAGTLRGLHYQRPPHAEDKLVRVVRGAVFDVAVDIRKDSPSYGRWHGVELSRENFRAFLIPKGCAHGYYTIKDSSEVLYFVSSPYAPEAEGGIAWNDPVLGVRWPGEPKVISPKDASWEPYPWDGGD